MVSASESIGREDSLFRRIRLVHIGPNNQVMRTEDAEHQHLLWFCGLLLYGR